MAVQGDDVPEIEVGALRASRPSAMPLSSAWYSGSMCGQSWVLPASRKKAQSPCGGSWPDSSLEDDAEVVFDLVARR
jgi:hypothetical protein